MVFPRVSHLFPPDAVVTRNEWPLFCPLVRMACCRCCEKTGACCTDEGCSQETCADCETLEGLFQGVDTVCGEDDECPCAPPADPGQCEKCVDGTPAVYCPEGKPNCCDGVCQAEPCGCPECYHCVINTADDATATPFVVGCASLESTEFEFCGGVLSSGISAAGQLCLHGGRFPLTGGEGCGPLQPTGWAWAEGYPEAFGDCPYVFVSSSSINTVACDDNRQLCPDFETFEPSGYCQYVQTEWRVYRVDCDSRTLVDVTTVASGDGQPLVQQLAGQGSGDGCECTADDYVAVPECEPELICGACCTEGDPACVGGATPWECENQLSGVWHLNARCEDDPCEPLEPLALRALPGTELKALLKTIGIVASPTCSCNKRAKVMDEKGCDWCEEHIDEIDGWLAEEAKKRKLPYISLAGKTLIRLAIRRARKKGNSR
jgi:hypothetical protein